MNENEDVFEIYTETEYQGQTYTIKQNKKTKEKVVVLQKEIAVDDEILVKEVLSHQNKTSKQIIKKAILRGMTVGLVSSLFIQELKLIGGIKNWTRLEPMIMERSPYENDEINIDNLVVSDIPSEYPTIETAYLGQILNQNASFQDEEELKETFKKYVSVYIAENPYFDYDLAYARLSFVSVIENSISNAIDNYYYKDTKAFYRQDNNTIHLMSPNTRQKTGTLFHELLHSMTAHDWNMNYNCKFITEGMTALLTLEYTTEDYEDPSNISYRFRSDQSYSYPSYTMICKILCELLGEDVMLKAYSTGDYTLLMEEMNDILGDEKTREVFECLSNYSNIVEKQSYNSSEAKELANILIDYFKLIYEEKYGYESEESDILNDYYGVLQKPSLGSNIVKFYYNNKLKKMYPASYIIKSDIEEDHSYVYELNPETNQMDVTREYYPYYHKVTSYSFSLANDPILYERWKENSEKQKSIQK